MVKFKLDENVPLQLKSIILNAGYKASSVYEQKLSGKKDKIVLEVCTQEKYVLITNDTDFENNIAYPPQKHAGIIVFKLRKQGPHAVSEAFLRLLRTGEIENCTHTTTIIEQHHIKIRK